MSSAPDWAEFQPTDTFEACIHRFYFPFLLRFKWFVLALWVCVAVICASVGLGFFDQTQASIDYPAGSPSAIAIQTMTSKFPGVSTTSPIIVVQHTTAPGVSAINARTQAVAVALNNIKSANPSVISSISGYWELINTPGLEPLAGSALSADNRTLISTISFVASAPYSAVEAMSQRLVTLTASLTASDLTVSCTGETPLFDEMSAAAVSNFGMIEAIVIPIAVIIIGIRLNSLRHLFIPLPNLLCTILLSFGIMTPISKAIRIDPLSPSIMISLADAVCFDYCLFFLVRFREEILDCRKTLESSVHASLLASGHVILLSGFTLLCTFLILLVFPSGFLASIGWSCGSVMISALLCNISITPALILAFPSLAHFDGFKVSYLTDRCKRDRQESVVLDESSTLAMPQTDYTAIPKPENGNVVREPSIWIKLGLFVTDHAGWVLLVSAMLAAPFLYFILGFRPTSDETLIFLLDGTSFKAFQQMSASFPVGSLDPYSVIAVSQQPNSILSPTYFAFESDLISKLLTTQSAFLTAASVNAVSFFDSSPVSFVDAVTYLSNSSSPLYNSTRAFAYRAVVVGSGLLNQDGSAALIQLFSTQPPNSDVMKTFVVNTRSLLTDASASSPPSLPINLYLYGAYSPQLDLQNKLYSYTALDICLSLGLVLTFIGFSFGSIVLALRLLVTVVVSLIVTYGFMVIVFQPGAFQNALIPIAPSLKYSTGIYWLVPFMTFSILVGLSLDYDILVMSRVLEFRKLGWSDRASVCLALEKTGSVITCAGLIMAISFAGLFIPQTIVLNQFGVALFMGVVIDTFLVRALVVPAVIALMNTQQQDGCDVNWWPMKMPPVVLDSTAERAALLAGLEIPPSR